MRLPARFASLRCVGRRPGRAALVGILILAGAATTLAIGAGFSDRATKRLSGPTVAARMASATAAMVAERPGPPERRGAAAYYRRTAGSHVSEKAAAGFLPLYREAEGVYGVNWRLIASIHRQETAFSTAPSTYRGLNDFGCCAGPMQFNVTNGPVSTWEQYRRAFRDGRRPARYPHRTRSHPSIYDDFDAIMAAGSLLRDSGAGRSLDFGAWSAAYSYYGHDLFGVTYANQILARAEAWQRDGFCPNCVVDEGLVAEFEDAYGRSARRQLTGPERRAKKHRRRKLGRDHDGERRDRRKGRGGGSGERARQRPPARRPRPSRPPSAKKDRPAKPSPPPTQTGPSTTPPVTAPSPPAGECPLIRKLFGC